LYVKLLKEMAEIINVENPVKQHVKLFEQYLMIMCCFEIGGQRKQFVLGLRIDVNLFVFAL
jgi:hypothetical protein